MASWAQLDDARAPGRWPDSAAIDDAVLAELLDASCERLRVYAPAPPVDAAGAELVPERYVLANVYDARDLWTARTLDGGVIGFDAYAVTVKPLTPQVRSLLRPPRPAVAR